MTHIQRGEIVFRVWDAQRGLHEVIQPFESLEALFALCTARGSALVTDRITIRGVDESGAPCTLTFAFQSLSVG